MNYHLTCERLVILLADELTRLIKECGPEDHKAGKCYCMAESLIEKARELIKSKKGKI